MNKNRGFLTELDFLSVLLPTHMMNLIYSSIAFLKGILVIRRLLNYRIADLERPPSSRDLSTLSPFWTPKTKFNILIINKCPHEVLHNFMPYCYWAPNFENKSIIFYPVYQRSYFGQRCRSISTSLLSLLHLPSSAKPV